MKKNLEESNKLTLKKLFAKNKRIGKRFNLLYGSIIIILFILLFIAVINVPVYFSYSNKKLLIINEIMSSNKSTVKDIYGEYSDYIELYNGNDYDIDLTGYFLSDDYNETKKWVFPSGNIKAHEYLIVYASNRNTVNNNELHTNFKLDNKGESVILSEPDGDIISKIYNNGSLSDTSYGYNGKEYVYYYNGTPGYENSGETSKKVITSYHKDIKLYINEYLVNNTKIKENNEYYSLIELYNGENYKINLSGFSLSDDSNNLSKYVFPNISIDANSYLVVYFSGLNKVNNNKIHTNFKLNKHEGLLILSNDDTIIDQIVITETRKDISSGRFNNKWYSYDKTSFGSENKNNYLKVLKNEIIINEVSSINDEFIELKNIGNNDIDLSKYSIGDKNNKAKLTGTIKKNQIIYLVGSDKYEVKNNIINLGFHINNSDEEITLYEGNKVIDSIKVLKLTNGVSTGLNAEYKKVYYKEITKGKSNSTNYYLGYSMNPEFSIDGGYVNKNTSVTLTTNDNSKIYYTTDGSKPNKNSKEYKDAINITKTTVIRAISYKNDYLESDIVTRTFFVNDKHDISIVSLSSNNSNFYGYSSGILAKGPNASSEFPYKGANFWQDMEKEVSFELYEKDGKIALEFIAGITNFGGWSRGEAQKSFAVHLRKTYGTEEITYPFFDKYNTVKSFILRNGGQDAFYLKIKDAFLQQVINGQMDLDFQDYYPVAVYINGEYYGMELIREKTDVNYVVRKTGLEKEDITFIEHKEAHSGSYNEYKEILEYVKKHDMSKDANYQHISELVDLQNLCNYWVTLTYFGQSDPVNQKYYKTKDGKWRWILYDIDQAFSVALSDDINWNLPFATSVPLHTYSLDPTLMKNLMKNKDFREMYIKTWATHLKTTFKPDRMIKILNEMSNEVDNEMKLHINRWKYESFNYGYKNLTSYQEWENRLKAFETRIKTRYSNAKSTLKSGLGLSNDEYKKYFGDL